jgi:chromosome segregation ATPase
MKKGNTDRKVTPSSKRRSRSKSKCIEPNDDELLVKALNERAASDRLMLISREEYEELKQCRQTLKTKKERPQPSLRKLEKLSEENTHLKEYSNSLGEEVKRLEKELEAANTKIKKLSTANNKLQRETRSVGKLKLEHLNGTISPDTKTLDIKQYKDLESEHAKLKEQLKKYQTREETVIQYRQALDRMRETMQMMREKLKEVKGDALLKQQLEDKDNTIKNLTEEKEHLNQHIKSLQESLAQQTTVIDHLKGIITALPSQPNSESAESFRNPTSKSPPLQEFLESRLQDLPSAERTLQAEIAYLDYEIEELQQSLQRALTSH